MTDKINDYPYFENMAAKTSLQELKGYLLEEQINGFIIPELVFELIDKQIKKHEENIGLTK